MKFSIYKFLKKRPLSHSALSSFAWNKEQWYDTYINGNRQSSREMTFGSMVDKKIQEDSTFIPTLPRYPEMQWEGKTTFNKIPLVGKADGICFDNFLLADYKTGKNPWNQKKADETKQFDFYLLLIFLTKKIKPEKFKCRIHWLPTKCDENFKIMFRDDPVVPITFETKRTMADILRFSKELLETVDKMQEYVDTHA